MAKRQVTAETVTDEMLGEGQSSDVDQLLAGLAAEAKAKTANLESLQSKAPKRPGGRTAKVKTLEDIVAFQNAQPNLTVLMSLATYAMRQMEVGQTKEAAIESVLERESELLSDLIDAYLVDPKPTMDFVWKWGQARGYANPKKLAKHGLEAPVEPEGEPEESESIELATGEDA